METFKQGELFPSLAPVDAEAAIAQIEKHWKESFDFRASLLALYRVGSHSHGTHIPPTDPTGIDDTDYMAVVLPPMRYKVGLRQFEHAQIKEGDLDCVVYEWRKYLGLLLKSNPNVVGTLWLEDRDKVYMTGDMEIIHDKRDLFSSKQCYPAFIGYAKAQLHKMTHNAHQGYMGDKRKKLVEKFGYDTKNAAHLIRLLRMAEEFLLTGKMQVFRWDAEVIKEIKMGEWSLEEVQAEAERLFELAAINLEYSKLPDEPDSKEVEEIMLQVYHNCWDLH